MPDYREFAPGPRIAAHVHCLWSFEGTEAGIEQAVPPDGRCELIVHRGTPYEEHDAGDGAWKPQPSLLFAGQLTRPLLLRARGPVAVLGVRFRTAGAWAFVGRALAATTDRRIDVAELHGDATRDAFAAALDDAPDDVARWSVVSSYVADAIGSNAARRDAAVERCVERLRGSEGRVTTAAMTALTGLTSRQLQRRFAEVVGISPRRLAAIVRLRRVFDVLRDEPFARWSDRAQAAGFFDHPQMSRDFRRFVGSSPSAWDAAGHGLAASLAGLDPDRSRTYKTGA